MTDELFTTPETLSPRLRWMRRHLIELDAPWSTSEGGRETWQAYSIKWGLPFGEGATQDEALVDYAEKHGIPDWRQQ